MPDTAPVRPAPVTEGSSGNAEAHDGSLPVSGFKGTPDEIDRQWYEDVYRGRGDSMAQLT